LFKKSLFFVTGIRCAASLIDWKLQARIEFTMKTLVVILLAAAVACASTYFVVSTRNAAQLKQAQAAWDAEKSQLQVSAKNSSAPVEKVIMVSTPTTAAAPAEESPQDILNDLLNIKLGTGSERNTALRLVVFKLETLTQRGKAAIPAIRAFIGRNVDVDYETQDNNNNGGNNGNNNATAGGNNNADVNAATNVTADANAGNNAGNNNPGNNRRGGLRGGGNNFRGVARRARNIDSLRTDWVVPPSLRLGLVGALKEIGGAESEQPLAEMLSSTARGVEVAYLTVMLEEIAPGKYRDTAVGAAKELLMNPPAIDSPDQLDNLSKSYLYGVLEFYKDTSFAVNAQQMLVGADGRLDQDAMDYLSTVLKDQSVPALYAAYQNSNLTNQFDKMNLGRQLMGYVGQNSQANQFFTDTLNNPDLDSRTKAFAVIQLAGGGFGPFGADVPTDPQIASQRIALLNSLLANYAGDPMLSQAIPLAIGHIQANTPVDPSELRPIIGGGGGRGFGGRGGGGNGGSGGGNNGGN
jgi:hypothetical protein